jgi:hypothetical protein
VIAQNMVKSSIGKHESDIPKIECGDALPNFMLRHKRLLLLTKPVSDRAFEKAKQGTDSVISRLSYIEKDMKNGELSYADRDYIFRLEKKFVLYGELFTHYDHNFTATSEITNYPALYIHFASLLLTLYLIKADLNSLNTAIRLIDHSVLLIEKGHDGCELSQLKSCLTLEESAFGKLRFGT